MFYGVGFVVGVCDVYGFVDFVGVVLCVFVFFVCVVGDGLCGELML